MVSIKFHIVKFIVLSGKSDLHVQNVSNLSALNSCGYYGGVDNDMGTWGVSVYQTRFIYLIFAQSFRLPLTGQE